MYLWISFTIINFNYIYIRPEKLDEINPQEYTDYFIIILFIGGIADYCFLHNFYPSPDNTWNLNNIILYGV